MPLYVVERLFPDGLAIPMTEEGAKMCQRVAANNAGEVVTWVHSYVSEDKTKTFCVYEGPSPEAIRKVAQINSLPVSKVTQVNVLNPYFYK